MAKEKNIKVAQMDETRTRFAAYVAGSNKPNRFKNIDDAVNALIAEYHLHQG